jgi:spore coat assembly protein SafA
MAVNKVPFGTYSLQDLGRTRRVMRGAGVFVGSNAYAQFGALANTFYEEGPGLLIHPLWQTANAYFVELRLEQEPMPNYVSYSFAFWEDTDRYSGAVQEVSAGDSSDLSGGAQASTAKYHQVVRGDTLWALSITYGISLQELIALNPQIKNPNLILPGDEVRVR